MERSRYYKNLFFIGAIWNWLATLSFLLGYQWLFPLFKMDLPQYPVFLILFMGLAFIFGIGYYWVSRDISKNHDIVKMGILGKLFVFASLLWAAMTGQISWLLAGAGTGDLILAILFIEFLVFCRRNNVFIQPSSH